MRAMVQSAVRLLMLGLFIAAHAAVTAGEVAEPCGGVKLTAPEAAALAYFGGAVAIDGDRVIIGEENAGREGSEDGSGAAHIFRFDDNNTPLDPTDDVWLHEATLTADDAQLGDQFGNSVSISGRYALVGAWNEGFEGPKEPGERPGAAYIFWLDDNGTPLDPSDDVWIQNAKLTAADGAGGDQFGWDVAIDENTAVVGAPSDDDACVDDPECNSGSTYVYRRDDGGTPDDQNDDVWLFDTKLVVSNGSAGDVAGRSVAVDGDWVVVGSPLRRGSAGAVDLFRRNDNGTPSDPSDDFWTRIHRSDSLTGDFFGGDVDIDGDWVVVGASKGDGLIEDAGTAVVYYQDGGTWLKSRVLYSSTDVDHLDRFGQTVSIDGDRIVVGAQGAGNGTAWVFRHDDRNTPTDLRDDTWPEQVKLALPDGRWGNLFGGDVAVSGGRMVVGERRDDSCLVGNDCGAAHLFDVGDCDCDQVGRCGGHGVCVDTDTCACELEWFGPSCSTLGCIDLNSCSGHGLCVEIDRCQCDSGWGGDDCSVFTCSGLSNCSGHGVCVASNVCECDPGWFDADCGTPTCTDVNNCSGHGTCIDINVCNCSWGYAGEDCSEFSCADFNDCWGNGTCVGPHVCECDPGWSGLTCSSPTCEGVNNCSNRGRCVAPDVCECDPGWLRNDCSWTDCAGLDHCNGNGTCVAENECECDQVWRSSANELVVGWSGADCSVPDCEGVNNCSGNGTCVLFDVCECNPGWGGAECIESSVAELSMIPVSSTGAYSVAGNEVTIQPGERVTFDIYLADWDFGGDGSPALRGYNVEIPAPGFGSGTLGRLSPPTAPCLGTGDCVDLFGGVCLNSGGDCLASADCPAGGGRVCNSLSTCAGVGRCLGYFINIHRPDFVFYSLPALASVSSSYSIKFNAHLLVGSAPDPGFPAYLGTLALEAPAYARGTFTIQPEPSFLDENSGFISPVRVVPVRITVADPCAGLNSCSGHGSCVGEDTCACDAGWSEEDCSRPNCEDLDNCSGNGACVGPDLCTCDSGWDGIDCSTEVSGCCFADGSCQIVPISECVDPGAVRVPACFDDEDLNGVNDACECVLPTSPQADLVSDSEGRMVLSTKGRYLSFVVTGPPRVQAIRVKCVDLPAPFDALNGTELWVGGVASINENSGTVEAQSELNSFTGATLQCQPFYTDWTALGMIHVSYQGIVPGALYEVQVIDGHCDLDIAVNFSNALRLPTNDWGDVVGLSKTVNGTWTAPDGRVNITTDVTAVLDKFRNMSTAPIKARADLEPGIVDHQINISDVVFVLEAFRGSDYPFTELPSPCDP